MPLRPHTVLAALVGAAVTLALAGPVARLVQPAAMAQTAVRPNHQNPERLAAGSSRWEYAELILQGRRAILRGGAIVQAIDLPDNWAWREREERTVFRNELGRLEPRLDATLYFANLVGRDGWEIVSSAPLAENGVYLVRRETRPSRGE
jgi:hypothetical protein